jgi:hypothetical protein
MFSGKYHMDLNTIQLSPSLIRDLFPHSLVAAPRAVQATGGPSEDRASALAPYRFLGSHKKDIAVILRSKDARIISDQHLAFLSKMLEACKLNLGDVAIINDLELPVRSDTLHRQLRPKIVLLFGLEPIDIKLPFNIPTFKIQPYDGCTYLYCPPLEELNQDSEEGRLVKSKLWLCLKSLFGL